MSEGKSLSQWRYEIKSVGRKHWGTFYAEFVGGPPSNYPRFFKALKNYGDLHMFEAIVLSSNQTLEGDPLNYVIKVAHELWKEDQRKIDDYEGAEKEIQDALTITKKKNDELAKKLKRQAGKSVKRTV